MDAIRSGGRTRYSGAITALAVVLWTLATAMPASADDFYKGKQITFIIGTAPGGGYDSYSRLVIAHLGRHLAGNPDIIAQNMPGASSIRATNFLFNAAPRDGTTIGMIDQATYLNEMTGAPGLKAKAVDFNWLGRILDNSAVLYASSKAKVKKAEDAFHTPLIIASTGAASNLNWTVLKKALGMDLKIVTGYRGSNESLLAMLRGEVDALSMPWTILKVQGAQLIRDKQINLLLQTGAERNAEIPDVPRMIDLGRTDEERKLLELFASPSVIGRSVVAPPGVPVARVAELRQAFAETMKDPAFLKEAELRKLDLDPMSGEKLQAAVVSAGQFPPALVEKAREIAKLEN
jgi:tripartite-type tricarboxylate transporter receptor subunit TctC